MSACISRHGEYSDHEPDDAYTCTRCFVLDEAGLRADRDRARDLAAALEAENAAYLAACREKHAKAAEYGARINTVRSIHSPARGKNGHRCREDGQAWPCPTAEAAGVEG